MITQYDHSQSFVDNLNRGLNLYKETLPGLRGSLPSSVTLGQVELSAQQAYRVGDPDTDKPISETHRKIISAAGEPQPFHIDLLESAEESRFEFLP